MLVLPLSSDFVSVSTRNGLSKLDFVFLLAPRQYPSKLGFALLSLVDL